MSALATPLRVEDVRAATGGRTVRPGGGRAVAGVSIDSRTISAGDLFVAIAGPRFDGHDFLAEAAARGAAAAVVHKDVPAPGGLGLVRVPDTAVALGDIGRWVRMTTRQPVVAVTGSTGKTTTKEMAAALAARRGPVLKSEGNLNNRYGLPLTLVRVSPEHRTVVLEVGMSAAGELRQLSGIARPDVAVITNVAPVHLEFFESVDDIARAKAEVLEGLMPNGVAVLNGDDPRVRRIGEQHRGEVVWFGRDRAFAASAENWRGTIHGMRFDLRLRGETVDVALPLSGQHHMWNFLAAAAVAHRLGVAAEAIAAAAPEMAPAAHRGEVLRLGERVTVVDDSYNSNPVAVASALEALALAGSARRVAFLGDMLELGAEARRLHEELGESLPRRADVVVGVGPLGRGFVDGARRGGAPAAALHAFPDAPSAAASAVEIVRPGDAVLVKGSRGVRMEKVVDALVARFGRVEA